MNRTPQRKKNGKKIKKQKMKYKRPHPNTTPTEMRTGNHP